jgi:hypothetical protein
MPRAPRWQCSQDRESKGCFSPATVSNLLDTEWMAAGGIFRQRWPRTHAFKSSHGIHWSLEELLHRQGPSEHRTRPLLTYENADWG